MTSTGRCDRGRWRPLGAKLTARWTGRGAQRTCTVTARTAGGWTDFSAR